MPHSVIQQNIIKFLVTDISATVAPIGVKFCIMVNTSICPGCVFCPFEGGAPRDPPNLKFARLRVAGIVLATPW